MYKIYFENRVLFLSDKNTINSEIIHEYLSKQELQQFIEEFKCANYAHAIVLHSSVDFLFEQIKSCFKYIEAAGGLVLNSENCLLVMYRRDKWDLPKGKVDKGELISHAALREVAEETGIDILELGEELEPSYHTYCHKGNFILKKTYWFRMKHSANQILIPQVEEDITELLWLSLDEKEMIIENTYPTIINVLINANWLTK